MPARERARTKRAEAALRRIGPGPLTSVTRWGTFLRKMAAMMLVVTSLVVGIMGLGAIAAGRWWGLALILAAPFGIWGATRLTPEGATTGYFDQNL